MDASSSRLAGPSTQANMNVNGVHSVDGTDQALLRGTDGEPSLEELERELPVVGDGQVSLGELLSRVVQNVYAELTVMAET